MSPRFNSFETFLIFWPDLFPKEEAKDGIVEIVDWEAAFDRQCHRKSCPLSEMVSGIFMSYFQRREMAVKRNGDIGHISMTFPLPEEEHMGDGLDS